MQLTGLSFSSAPQGTGHPLGLPAANENAAEIQKVQPVLDARNPETQLGSHQSPASFWHAAQGEPDPRKHNAPPSIMQIKISRILNDQATEHAKTKVDEEGIGDSADPLPQSKLSDSKPIPYPHREPDEGEIEPMVVLPELAVPRKVEEQGPPPQISPASFAAYEETSRLSANGGTP